jgi:integrase
MIFSIQKRKRRQKGKLVETRSYYLRYRLGEMPVDRWASLSTTDKAAAHAKAKEFIEKLEREQAGLTPARELIAAANAPLVDLCQEYVTELEARGGDAKYVTGTAKRIQNVIRECRWSKLRDVSPEAFMAWRRGKDLKVKTLNDYLTDVSSFFGWLVKMDRLGKNPLSKVEKIARKEDEEEKRRAFTRDEFERLRKIDGSRSLIYTLAVYTGLRRAEIAALVWGDVVTGQDGRTGIKLRASTTKNGKAALQPVPDWLVDELMKFRPEASKLSTKVFPSIPRMPRFYKDLDAAGIARIDERGHVLVFHSLRHTLATWLWETGANPRVIQELMRHGSLDLTANRYTDTLGLELRKASDDLPAFGAAGYTQIRAQISDDEGQTVSQDGEMKSAPAESKPPGNKRLSRALSWCGEVGQMVRAAGFEPATPSV